MAGQIPQAVDEQGTAAGVLLRLWWMFIGNFILALCIVFIVKNRGSFWHQADPVFGITVLSLVLVRFIDIRFCKGLTATGGPASMRTWVRYAVFLIVGAAVVWAAAHGVSHMWSRTA